MTIRACSATLLLVLQTTTGFAAGNHYLPLDRPFTSRNAEPSLVEREMARQIGSDGPMSFIFPRPCKSMLDSSSVCGDPRGFSYRDSGRGREISVAPLAAYEVRLGEEGVHAFEAGTKLWGGSGPISFLLDARMFTELHDEQDHPSYDREFVERQDEEASGSVAYSSYSRYRSNLSADFAWGRLTAARDAIHWGPGLITNLSFNQDALPFNHLSWTSHLGPVSVISLYGHLAIHGDSLGTFNRSKDSRSLYAHRYEWRAAPNLVIGMSEQLVLYETEEPFAFAPVVPLFILKGTGLERNNNGNISGDLAWRITGHVLAYSEFFIDDIQSPTSLFDDNWGNKWAWMTGVHGSWSLPLGQAGLVVEYSRVEPWVYTHYISATAQAANGGHPLGNPLGPNSQWMALRPYLRGKGGWYASAQADLTWKGHDLGSGMNDIEPDEAGPKSFIEGVGSPLIRVRPQLAYGWKSIHLETSAILGSDTEFSARLHWQP